LSLETPGKRHHHWAQLLRQNLGFNFGIGAESAFRHSEPRQGWDKLREESLFISYWTKICVPKEIFLKLSA